MLSMSKFSDFKFLIPDFKFQIPIQIISPKRA